MDAIKLNAIVAICNENRGIGINNTLPWSLSEDWEYFLRFIRTTEDENKVNALIMGRLTWLSIPKEMTPFKPCISIIISKTFTKSDIKLDNPTDMKFVFIEKSIEDAIRLVKTQLNTSVESLIAVGGTQIYREALNSQIFHRLYLTRIFENFKCEIYMEPENFLENLRKLNNQELEKDSKRYKCDYNCLKVDNKTGIEFIFEVYQNNSIRN